MYLGIRRSADTRNTAKNLLRERIERAEVIPEDLDGKIGFDAGDRFIDTHSHRLREVIAESRDLREVLIDGLNQLFFTMKAMPLVHGPQQEVGIAFVDAHCLSRKVGATDLYHHISDLRKRTKFLLDALADLDRVRKGDSR